MKSSRPLRWLRLLARVVLVSGATLTILFLMTVLAVRLLVVPHIGDYRAEITSMIADNVGRKVSIGEINAGWNGWSPTLNLVDIRLFDAAGNEALALPRVDTSVSWRSIVAGEIRLRRLDVTSPQLLIRRDRKGHLSIAGMDMEQPAESQDNAAAEWFAKQRLVTIRDGTVMWQDDLRDAPPLRLEQVNLVLENSGKRHRFGLTAVPPGALAAPLDLRGDILLPSFNEWPRAQGRLYSRLDFVDVAQAKAWLPLPFELRSGRGALRGWLEFGDGEPRDLTLDLELDDVRTRLKSNLAELDLAHLAGRVAWRHVENRTEVSTRALELATRNGARLKPGDITMRHAAAQAGKPATGEIRSSQLQLEPILALVQYLPIDDKLRLRLARFAPVGVLETGSLSWTGDADKLVGYEVRAQFRDVGISGVDALPGITRLTGSIDANAKSGTLNVVADGTRITLPRVFAAPLDLDTASAQVSWKVADQVAVKVHRLAFANADTAGSVQGEYRTLDKGPGWVDLTATLTRAKVPSVHKYLPTSVSPSLRDWLRGALLAGNASDGHLTLKGNLFDFPFADGKGGTFVVTAKAAEASLDYADHWPRIENIRADVRFEGAKMQIDASEATTLGLALNRVHVVIPDMGAEMPHLLTGGEGGGSTEGFLHFIDQSPVGSWIGHFTQNAKATGNGHLGLSLDIPLRKYDDVKINGEYAFTGNSMQLGPDIPRIDKASGKFLFTERDFKTQDLVAEALGGTASVQIAVADSKIRVGLAGNADIAEVRKLYPFPLSDRARGRTDWQFTMQSAENDYNWTVESGLRGIAVDLPPPLAKKAEATLPLRVERQGIDKTHDRLTASLGTIAQMEAIRVTGTGDKDKDRERGPVIQKMAFSLGKTPARAERDGLWVRGSVDDIDVEPWLAIAQSMTAGTPATATNAGSAAAAAGGANATGDKAVAATVPGALVFAGIDVRAESSVLYGRRLRNLRVEARNQGGSWKIDLESDDITGAVTWQPTKSGDSGLITARLKKLSLPDESTAGTRDAAAPPAQAPRKELPALDVTADSYLGSKGNDLGRLELKARPDGADWQIETLSLRTPESDLTASGRWKVQGAQGATQRTDLDVKLDVRDVAKFLARHGVTEGVRGGSGRLEGQLNWAGGPQDFNYPTLNGRFRLDVHRGQFTKVDPGIGKLLGVLNLEALARRLTFDFRDVVAEGYSFDEMAGDIALKNGVMTTSNLHITGPAAKVDIDGTADIAKETQHLKVRVQPALSGGLAAAAAAATVNPIVGAGVLLGSTILRDPVGKMFAGEYDVSGTWVDPKVQKLAGLRHEAPRELGEVTR